MRKRSAVLALGFTLNVGMLFGQANSTPIAAKSETGNVTCQVAVDSTPAKDRYERVAFWGNIALVLVGFGGVVVGVRSLAYLRRQTEATRVAADAALTQANHIAKSERAWIEVIPFNWSIEFFPMWEKGDPLPEGPLAAVPISHQFVARIKNVGRTPAKIEGISVQYLRSPKSAQYMESEPDLGEIHTENFFLLPNGEMAATAILSPERGVLTKAQVEAIKDGRQFLYAYGVVKYRDVYDCEHETRFGYTYRTPEFHMVVKDGKIERISVGTAAFQHGGPTAYNLVT